MKKILLALVAFITVGTMSAYTITFNNNTQYPLQAWVVYSSLGLCSSDSVAIPAGKRGLDIATGGCCAFRVDVRRADVSTQRGWWQFHPPSTGAGIACRSFSVNINANPDGSLALTK